MGRHVLFYSEFCFFSKDVMALITKKNVAASFLLVCVDTYRQMLPVFVHSVPTILTHDQRVLEGQAVLDLVDNMQSPAHGRARAGSGTGLHGDVGADADLGALGPGGMAGGPGLIECSSRELAGSSWSDDFAFLEPDQGHATVSGMGAYSGILEDTNIPLVPEPNGGGEQRRGGGTGQGQGQGHGQGGPPSALETYTSQRDSDTAILRKSQLGGGDHQQQHRT